MVQYLPYNYNCHEVYIMPILFFALWVILNGRITLEIVLFGIAVTALIYIFLIKVLGYSVSSDITSGSGPRGISFRSSGKLPECASCQFNHTDPGDYHGLSEG